MPHPYTVKLQSGKEYMMFKRCEKFRSTDDDLSTKRRTMVANTTSRLFLIGEMKSVQMQMSNGAFTDYTFISTDIGQFTNELIWNTLKFIIKYKHLTRVHSSEISRHGAAYDAAKVFMNNPPYIIPSCLFKSRIEGLQILYD